MLLIRAQHRDLARHEQLLGGCMQLLLTRFNLAAITIIIKEQTADKH